MRYHVYLEGRMYPSDDSPTPYLVPTITGSKPFDIANPLYIYIDSDGTVYRIGQEIKFQACPPDLSETILQLKSLLALLKKQHVGEDLIKKPAYKGFLSTMNPPKVDKGGSDNLDQITDASITYFFMT